MIFTIERNAVYFRFFRKNPQKKNKIGKNYLKKSNLYYFLLLYHKFVLLNSSKINKRQILGVEEIR